MSKNFSIDATFRAIDRMTKPARDMQKNVSRQFGKMITGFKSSIRGMGNSARSFFTNQKLYAKKWRGDITRMQTRLKNFGATFKMVAGATVLGGIVALGAGLKYAVSQASMIEDATAAFTPLMGGAEKANELVDRLNKTASSTPFQFENISAAAKQLLPVMNQDIDKTIETFRMLGDTAGGNAQKLDTITRGFTKSMLKGKVDMESLNMISEAGVPIYDQLSKNMGVSTAQLFKMVSAGKVTTTQLTDTFKTMTSEGGLFFNGMSIASQTFSGKMSTLKDNVALTAAKIGQSFVRILSGKGEKSILDILTAKVQQLGEWVATNQGKIDKFAEGVMKVVFFMGGFASVLIKVIKFLSPLAPFIIGVVVAFKAYSAILAIAAIKQMILNAVMTANPIGLIIVGIGLLIGVIIYMIKNWDTVKVVLKSVYDRFGFLLGPIFLVIEVIKLLVKHADKIKVAFFIALNALKTGFFTVFDGIKKVFYTFADYFLTIWGNIIKTVLSGAAFLGSALGIDTSGIDKVINKISEVQASVRGKSFIGDIQGGGAGGVTTQGQTISKSIQTNNNNQSVTIRNSSSSPVSYKGNDYRTGSSFGIRPSGA